MTGPKRIRKREAVAEAYLFNGHNHGLIVAWADGSAYEAEGLLYIITDREDVAAEPGDHIIRGLVGEYYPCTPAAYQAGWEEL